MRPLSRLYSCGIVPDVSICGIGTSDSSSLLALYLVVVSKLRLLDLRHFLLERLRLSHRLIGGHVTCVGLVPAKGVSKGLSE